MFWTMSLPPSTGIDVMTITQACSQLRVGKVSLYSFFLPATCTEGAQHLLTAPTVLSTVFTVSTRSTFCGINTNVDMTLIISTVTDGDGN
jgi:hypothetical protein